MRRGGRFLLLVAVGWAVGAATDLGAAQLGFTTREALLVSVPLCLLRVLGPGLVRRRPGCSEKSPWPTPPITGNLWGYEWRPRGLLEGPPPRSPDRLRRTFIM